MATERKPALRSRKLWISILACVVQIVLPLLGIPVPVAAIAPLLGYVAAEGIADGLGARKSVS